MITGIKASVKIIGTLLILLGLAGCATEEQLGDSTQNEAIFPILSIFLSVLFCNMDNNATPNNTDTASNELRIKIGSSTFNATLFDNPTVTEFKSRLPLTVTMSELNGNKKLYRFPTDLPVNPSIPVPLTLVI